MYSKRLFLAVLAILLVAYPAHAMIFTYSAESAYNANVLEELWRIDFQGVVYDYSDGNFVGQVNFGSPSTGSPDQVLYAAEGLSDPGGMKSWNAVGMIDGIFAAPVYAFAWEFSYEVVSMNVDLFDEAGNSIGSTSVGPTGFIGIVSTEAVHSFRMHNGPFTAETYSVDNFRTNAVVPEPGTLLLLGTGLVGIGAAFRRRRSKY